MRFILRLTFIAALMLSFAGPGLAQTAAQRDALTSRIEAFATAMQTGDMDAVIRISVPPKLIEQIAAQNNATPAQVIEATVGAMKMAMEAATIVSFNVDIKGARFATLADGTLYALIPTETVIDMSKMGAGKTRTTSSTLGLLDNDTWYLLRIDNPQQTMSLTQVYPALADVEFPEATTEPLPE